MSKNLITFQHFRRCSNCKVLNRVGEIHCKVCERGLDTGKDHLVHLCIDRKPGEHVKSADGRSYKVDKNYSLRRVFQGVP